MSLPPLLKHVYNFGTEEVIRRGKKIFHSSGVQLLDVDHLIEQVRFRVRNDVYQNYYTVTVGKYLDPKNLSIRCQCPYNLGDICRHEVAALFQLNDIVQSGFFENTDITYDQKHTVVRMRSVNRQTLGIFSDPETLAQAEMWASNNKAIITANKNDIIEAEVPDEDHTYKVLIKQNEERYFDTSCGCDAKTHPLCVHKAAVFLQVLNAYGSQYFLSMRDWDEQKNKLLKQYGYSLDDDLTDKFTFTYDNGKPFLRVLDPTLKKVSVTESSAAHKYSANSSSVQKAPAVVEAPAEDRSLGIVIDANIDWYPFVNFLLIDGITDDDGRKYLGPIHKLELSQYINPLAYKEAERDLIPVIRKFAPEEILKFLKKNLPFGDLLDDHKEVLKDTPAEDVKEQVWEYLLPKYKKILERFRNHQLCFIHNDKKQLSSATIQPVAFAERPVHPQIRVGKEKNDYVLRVEWLLGTSIVPFNEVEQLNAALLVHDFTLYSTANIAEVQLIEQFLPKGELRISKADWPSFLKEKVMDWNTHVHIEFEEELVQTITDAKPQLRVYLQEREQMFIMQPAFVYNDIEVKWGFSGSVIVPEDGVIKILERDDSAELQFTHMLRNLHSDMQHNARDHFFYLPGSSVLANNWFFRFNEVMKEWDVQLYGFERLKNLRINANKPETRVQVSSGIDWFDASVEIVFGDQSVTITDVKKALAEKANFVKLADGSIGLLPEDWINKYSLLLKMGEAKNGKLRIKKYHFSVLDELLADIDEEALQQELEEKKERLSEIISSDFSSVLVPKKLQAELRPYQLAGFQWLVFLNEAGWGGILADDMGLGKTVQALAFFMHIKSKNPEAKFLVVCPTTLMYNWENEIKKFAPTLTHFIHHGPKRNAAAKAFAPYDVIITTYGTMRSDIKIFKDIEFDHVVLDESQSIKNPQSQVAKASLLLNAKNRIALSGTPIQNNTFDLYAQMNFLNPGLLGTREFFMNEFATPIDKFQEDEVKQQLKKLTYPFLLRRTKEQVAKDLPPKVETLLFCEMGADQRKIYEAYRNSYKSQILGMIEERGIERSQMHILQGLTKLRQICDSPAILNEEDKFPNYSVKQDELMREITENVGNHKALIFSQFLGMLALIRQQLEEKGIPYAYFDGSTTSTQREAAIQKFQNEEECRVFLISLKAGGVGLNLTAADYVYIVDPWWNPAVEQQAIDRTHRIGQTKNIFAYRLICKETIEEKMLQLQERKRALASDLVSDDSAFLKRLTKEDIAFLFS